MKININKTDINKNNLMNILEAFFTKHLRKVFWISMFLTIVFGSLLFNLNVSVGGDDSAYIVKAYNLIRSGHFPEFESPLYSIFLSPFIALFGLNIPFLKSLSFLLILGHQFLFYRAFKNRVSSLSLAVTLLLISINPFVLYFASQTYSEAFFLFMQSLLVYYLLTIVINKNIEAASKKSMIFKFLIIGLLLNLIALTKNIGLAVFMSVIIFFLIQKQWKYIFYTLLSFVFIGILFEIIKRGIWDVNKLHFLSQAAGIFMKNNYVEAKGKLSLYGFIDRFFVNSNLYLSKNLSMLFGFLSGNKDKTFTFLTVIWYLLFFGTFLAILKKNKYLLFTGCYLAAMYFTVFIAVNKFWDQTRLIVPFFPLTLLFLLSGIYYLFKYELMKKTQVLFYTLIVVLGLFQLKNVSIRVNENFKVLKNHLKGGKYYEFTPDWKNYIKMCEWSSINVPSENIIACRKPNIATIYGKGRAFYGIYKLPRSKLSQLNNSLGDTVNYLIVKDDQKESEIVKRNMLYYLKSKIAYVIDIYDSKKNSSVLYNVYIFEALEYVQMMNIFKMLEIEFYRSMTKFNNVLSEENYTVNIFNPDDMLLKLTENDVKYLILANLRQHEDKKGSNTINTIRYYIFYIQQKYPLLFKKIYQIGADDKEPAILVELLVN